MENTILKKNFSFHLASSTRDMLSYSICIICMILFLCSAFSKVAEHEAFYRGLSRVAVIGGYAGLIAWGVPAVEIIVSVLLIIPKTHQWGLYGFMVTMIVFTTYILTMLIWAKTFPCHCNLFVENLSWEQHVWFNLGFIGLSIFAIAISKKQIILNPNKN